MRCLSARGILSACILSAATVAALVAPGAASASVGEQCSGANIGGQGSSLQKLAQETVWIPDFKSSKDKNACDGKQGDKKTPAVTYNPSGSGAGLRSWGAEDKKIEEVSFGQGNAFVGTDEPPNTTQIKEIVKNESTETKDTLMTIPVAQESVAVIVHLPGGCTATSTVSGASDRLVFNDTVLQRIFAGTITKWGEVTGSEDGGDAITGAGCSEDLIHPVVRFDQSGTTHIFKRYLGLINTATLFTESETNETWDELSEGSQNTVWPKAADVKKPEAKGGGEEAALVAKEPGTIGYVNVAEARANSAFVPPTGGEKEPTFWAEIENGAKGSGSKIKYTYEDPSTDGDSAKLENANCKKTAYTNGTHAFPPPGVFSNWNEVTTSVPTAPEPLQEKSYSLCGMTYDLAFTRYELLPGDDGPSGEAEATTVSNYLKFVTGAKEGQKLLLDNDYYSLPKGEVQTDATEGAGEIGF
jgi:ABC-type phosphate transport system substrate-binding protein